MNSAAFTPDGNNVVAIGTDGLARVYRCEPCASLDDLKRIAKDHLLPADRRRLG